MKSSLWEWLAPAGLFVCTFGSLLVFSPVQQDAAYHNFADQSMLMGVPHFWNVLSNMPFIAVGFLGLWLLLRGRFDIAPGDEPPFFVLFLGVVLTGFGSLYYHFEPTTERLLWDRLPMTFGFMALFAAVLGERFRPRLGLLLLGPMLLLGVGSVLYWHFSEQRGAGDLRPYATVQFYPLIVIALLVLFRPSPYTCGTDYLIALGWYAVAKVLETFDGQVYELIGGVGGHPLKHVAAACGALWLVKMLLVRERVGKQ